MIYKVLGSCGSALACEKMIIVASTSGSQNKLLAGMFVLVFQICQVDQAVFHLQTVNNELRTALYPNTSDKAMPRTGVTLMLLQYTANIT